jgi:heme-degrading monooxygenase HmoA
MSTIRLIYARVPPEKADQAVHNWKEKCAPLMIAQEGCLSEHLLHGIDDPGEFISYSEWDSEESIRNYLDSEAHRQIKEHNRNIEGAMLRVKHYHQVR